MPQDERGGLGVDVDVELRHGAGVPGDVERASHDDDPGVGRYGISVRPESKGDVRQWAGRDKSDLTGVLQRELDEKFKGPLGDRARGGRGERVRTSSQAVGAVNLLSGQEVLDERSGRTGGHHGVATQELIE